MWSRLLWPVSVDEVLVGFTHLKAVERTDDFSAEV